MIVIRSYIATLLVCFAASACTSGSPVTGIDVQAVSSSGAASDTAPLELTDDGALGFALQSAYVHLRDIELDLPDDVSCEDIADELVGASCDDNGQKIVVNGPFDVDLITGTSTPDLSLVEIPVGLYRRVDFRVDDNPDETSFAVVADFEYEGQAYTLDLSLDFNEDIRIETLPGVSVDESTNLIAEFVVDDWLAGVDVGSCMEAGDVEVEGTRVIIDETSTSGSCSGIEDMIKSNMKDSGQMDKR